MHKTPITLRHQYQVMKKDANASTYCQSSLWLNSAGLRCVKFILQSEEKFIQNKSHTTLQRDILKVWIALIRNLLEGILNIWYQ